ncbi:MAG: DNA gyrase subunit A [Nitrosarchaeum sp.]|nr:DNA gyrase subunit A [Nitrosarchaeum sp.]
MAEIEDDNEVIEESHVEPSSEQGLFDVKSHEILPKLYLAYALSVIKDRSLPDIRDGLKPVARRILFSMYEMGVTHSKATKKSARIVGDTLGKYHPHGDGSVYGAAVRMVQPFTTRYPLIIGQGNFGSIEDPPAAMRYTEMKLSNLADEVLSDIDKETVDFMPNFDGTMNEPKVLPTKLPNVLLNGSVGIAVGMATSMAPHNLTEVIDALLAFIDNEDITIPELLQYIKGPDFPSGAYMFDSNIQRIYETGQGSVTLRAKAEIIDEGKRQKIIITELPYQLDKTKLLSRIAELYQDKEKKLEGIEGITDVRDESKADTRIVIELRKGTRAKTVLSTLFRRTELQTKYSILMRVLINNSPKLVNLKEILWHFIEHRKNVIIRRTEYDLRQSQKRAHILEGFLITFNNLDSMLQDIKTSSSTDETYKRLRKYKLSDEQIKSILELKIQRIAQFEQSTIIAEHTELKQKIEQLKKILDSEDLILQEIKREMMDIKHKYGDARRTKIIQTVEGSDGDGNGESNIEKIEEVQEDDVIVTVTHNGLVKRTPVSEYRIQNVRGRGLIGVDIKDADYVESMFQLSTRDYALVFTDKGLCHKMNVYDIPSLGRTAAGSSILNILNLNDEKIVKVIPIKADLDGKFFLFVTKHAKIKKLKAEKLQRPRSAGTRVIGINEGDSLVDVKLIETSGVDVLLITRDGKSIRFEETTIRTSGKNSAGIRAMKLFEGNLIVSMNIIEKNAESYIMMVTEKGYSKKTIVKKFRTQRRGGRGVVCMNVNVTVGKIISAGLIHDEKEQFILITTKGILIRLKSSQIRKLGRNTQGSRIQKLYEGDSIAAVAFLGVVEIEGKIEGVIDEDDLKDDQVEVDNDDDSEFEKNDDAEDEKDEPNDKDD